MRTGTNSSRTLYHDPYANLAAAILESGVKCNDTRFLESDWADVLKGICMLDDKMYGGKDTYVRTSKTNLPKR